MTEQFKQIIKEETLKLPKELQEVINTFDWAGITAGIGEKYILGEDEINNLQVETFIALIGLVNRETYKLNIEEALGLSDEEINEISNEITKKIFIPIYPLIIEKIKKNKSIENSNWTQNLNFIFSGGDYIAFLGKRKEEDETTNTTEKTQEKTLVDFLKKENVSEKFHI